tara:strand:+ start:1571 stop:5488 length:3918 start_codon:yes stop_codon:yes gene_type:complete
VAFGEIDETSQWLNYLQPEGLVLGANVLRNSGLTPLRQGPLDTEAAADALGLAPTAEREDDRAFVLRDPWHFLSTLLDWEAKLVAGAPDGPEMPQELSRTLPEHGTFLEPHLALLWRSGEGTGKGDPAAQLLIMLHPDLDADARGQFGADQWEASPHQRLERLLRETGVGTGILVARNALRLIQAPRGETAGWVTWPLAAMGRVDGRPMLAGLKLCLGRNAFWTGPQETRLRQLLKLSREAQNEVSEKLSSQVLEALYELLRGMHRADPNRIETLAEADAHHLYEGLLTCLMRLVFLLYAEDRDLLPTHKQKGLGELWDQGYSIKTLYSRLLDDEALNPDTMDERRGAWGRLLAVFRLIHEGYSDWVARRGGKLFDPDAFTFLEGRATDSAREAITVLPVSDGTILRILHGLMTVEGRGLDNQKVRERLSYRSLDVESIGSVYETVMGFTAKRASERMIALKDEKKLPNFIGLETLLSQKPADRQKWLKVQSIKLSTKQAAAIKAAETVDALIEALANAVDERASPRATPIGTGGPYLQPTDERRRSGSHYTPRSLTEPIVRHALEPAFERIGPNAAPEEVLSLKVLDPACGSGAFLVEACRQLGARLEQAWDMHKAEKPKIPTDEDEVIHARRLVAQRCLYGVDRNPMAVDLARLSLWLATLASEHEFTFLDHAIKAGDSLVGLTQHEIEAASWDTTRPSLPYIRLLLKDRLQRVLEGREAIRAAPDDVTRAIQQSRHDRIEDQLEAARDIGDAVVAAFFLADKPKVREHERQKIESILAAPIGVDQAPIKFAAQRFRTEQGWRPFHWEIEFPEVFMRDNPGFDAIVGNPPFLGGSLLSSAQGSRYVSWLTSTFDPADGKSDLVAYFFRQAFEVLRVGGELGLVATKTIRQGGTRYTALEAIQTAGGTIRRATRRLRWAGDAAVVVAVVHILKGTMFRCVLDGLEVPTITSFLMSFGPNSSPNLLKANGSIVFSGVNPNGAGFVFERSAANELVDICPRSADFLRPYLSSNDLNGDNSASPTRLIADVGHLSEDELREIPELYQHLRETVFPERQRSTETRLRERWWAFSRPAADLNRRITGYSRVLAMGRLATHHTLAFQSTGTVFSDALSVFLLERNGGFAVLQSRVHEVWAKFLGSSFKDDPRYIPEDCFETFPFPPAYDTDAALEGVGQIYHDYRARMMVDADEGMTTTYNRFHKDSETGLDIQRLRELHDELDRAALRAYGWDDLANTLQPEFLTEDTEDDHTYQGRYFWPAAQRDVVLARLLALNAERYQQEVAAGLHDNGKKRTRSDDEGDVLDDPE